MVILWCVFLAVLVFALLFRFPWTYTYEESDVPTQILLNQDEPVIVEKTDTVRSPCWRDPGSKIIFKGSYRPTTPGRGDLSMGIGFVGAERNWQRFCGEFVLAVFCGLLLHTVIFVLFRPSLSLCRFGLLSLVLPGLGSLCVLGWRRGYKRFFALVLPIPIAFLLFGPFWSDVAFSGANRAIRDAGVYPFVATVLVVVVASVTYALKDARQFRKDTTRSAVEQENTLDSK